MMLPKFITYIIIILWLSFQLVDCQMIPKQRQWHTATYIDNKLYILGGTYLPNGGINNEFLYIDVSSSFNTKGLSWQDLSNNTISPHSSATTVVALLCGEIVLFDKSCHDNPLVLNELETSI